MNNTPTLTTKRTIAAFAVAIAADLIQLPVTLVMMTGVLTVPSEVANIAVDCVAMVATIFLIGFHWLLLPSILVEFIPGLALIPTWTACVAIVVNLRKHHKAALPSTQSSPVPQLKN